MFRKLYPPSLVKSLLVDYGIPHAAAMQWGCDHVSDIDAIQQYVLSRGSTIEECGLFLSEEFP